METYLPLRGVVKTVILFYKILSGTEGRLIITIIELFSDYQKDTDSLFLVDTRQEWEFRTGHIKGAVNFPKEPTAWSRWRKAAALEKILGPDKNRTVVFY